MESPHRGLVSEGLLIPSLFGLAVLLANIAFFLTLLRRNSAQLRELDLRRREAEGAVREQKDLMAALVEFAPDAMVFVHEDGRIALVNARTEEISGYARRELLGQPVEILVPDGLRDRHRAHRDRYMASPQVRPMGPDRSFSVRRKDGSTVAVEVTLSPVAAKDGILVAAILRDVSKLRRAAEELARSNAELERFAHVASHDLQEPLRMVASYTELLGKRYKGKLDAEADEFIGYAEGGARRMQQLLDGLLTYSRVGSAAVTLAPTDCGRVLAEVLADLRLLIEESGAEIQSTPLPTLMADPPQMRRLFQNLIENALKFRGSAPSRIHVSARKDGSRWIFAVQDNGIGFDPKHLDRIFFIFQRLHTQDEYPGTGIGLAISKKIVERHGGRIWAESTPGEGATFFFSIPDHHDSP